MKKILSILLAIAFATTHPPAYARWQPFKGVFRRRALRRRTKYTYKPTTQAKSVISKAAKPQPESEKQTESRLKEQSKPANKENTRQQPTGPKVTKRVVQIGNEYFVWEGRGKKFTPKLYGKETKPEFHDMPVYPVKVYDEGENTEAGKPTGFGKIYQADGKVTYKIPKEKVVTFLEENGFRASFEKYTSQATFLPGIESNEYLDNLPQATSFFSIHQHEIPGVKEAYKNILNQGFENTHLLLQGNRIDGELISQFNFDKIEYGLSPPMIPDNWNLGKSGLFAGGNASCCITHSVIGVANKAFSGPRAVDTYTAYLLTDLTWGPRGGLTLEGSLKAAEDGYTSKRFNSLAYPREERATEYLKHVFAEHLTELPTSKIPYRELNKHTGVAINIDGVITELRESRNNKLFILSIIRPDTDLSKLAALQ